MTVRGEKPKLAIVGAGLSGLCLAKLLCGEFSITMFEKARGLGGRMATRFVYGENGALLYAFDHGVQCFTIRTDTFAGFLHPYRERGLVMPWAGDVLQRLPDGTLTPRMWNETHYVFCPHMTSLAKALATELAPEVTIRLNTEVAPLTPRASGLWALHDKTGAALGAFDHVVLTTPPAQGIKLLDAVAGAAHPFHHARAQACFALMLALTVPWPHDYMALRLHDNPVKWIWLQNAKPARAMSPAMIVVHSSNGFADRHVDDDPKSVTDILRGAFLAATGLGQEAIAHEALHRWRYALVATSALSPQNHSFNPPAPWHEAALNLSATGDFAKSSRLEDVYLAAAELARLILPAKAPCP